MAFPTFFMVNFLVLCVSTLWTLIYITSIIVLYLHDDYDFQDVLVEDYMVYVVYAKFATYLVLLGLVGSIKCTRQRRIYLTLAVVYLFDALIAGCLVLMYFLNFDEKKTAYDLECILFVSITNGVIILLDLIVLPILRCFHRQEEYRKNIGLKPIPRRGKKISRANDTLQNPFSATPSLFRNSVILESAIEESHEDFDRFRLDSAVIKEIDIKTGQIYQNQNAKISLSTRTNSITFHGHGLLNQKAYTSPTYIQSDVYYEEPESAIGDYGKSSFLINAKKQMTMSRKDSASSIDSVSSNESNASSKPSTVITNLSSINPPQSNNEHANISSTPSSMSEKEFNLPLPPPPAELNQSTSPSFRQRTISKPTHAPPKPPAAHVRNNSIDYVITEPACQQDSVKLKAEPPAPIRSSSIDSLDKPPTPTRSSSIDGTIAKDVGLRKTQPPSPLLKSPSIDQVDSQTTSVQISTSSELQVEEQTIVAKSDASVEQSPLTTVFTIEEEAPKRKMRPAKPLRPSLMHLKDEDKPTPIFYHKPPMSPPDGPPPPPPESESPFRMESFTYDNKDVAKADLNAPKEQANEENSSNKVVSNNVFENDGYVISLDGVQNSAITNDTINSVEKDENSNITTSNKNLKILSLSVPYTEDSDSTQGVIKDKTPVENTNRFSITLEKTTK